MIFFIKLQLMLLILRQVNFVLTRQKKFLINLNVLLFYENFFIKYSKKFQNRFSKLN